MLLFYVYVLEMTILLISMSEEADNVSGGYTFKYPKVK